MEKITKITVILFTIFTLGISTQCNSLRGVKSESELEGLTAEMILEMGAEEYVENRYNAATYYYQYIIDNFEETQEEVAWSYYEIGFIHYQKNRKNKALEYFQKVILLDSSSLAPGILAAQMIERLES